MKNLLFVLALTLSLQALERYDEDLFANPDWAQSFKISEVLYEEKSDHQHLIIFNNPTFGRVLALDGIIQTTEKDEFIYHEVFAHVPLMAHPHPKKVLIIGGGDGGLLREVARHKEVEEITMVEIDASVVDFSKEYLPNHSQGSFDDPRLALVIADGARFVAECEEKFDVILCDTTDPVGPGAALFSSPFYNRCHELLNEGGVFVSQNGVPMLQSEELVTSVKKLSNAFKHVRLLVAPIPTYIGGFMTFTISTDYPDLYEVSLKELEERSDELQKVLRYYTPKVHQASFAIPPYIERLLH